MLSSKASWVWYMNIARSCFYFHISLLYTYFTLRLTIYMYRSRTQISLPIYLHRILGPKYNTLVFSYPSFYIYKHYNSISHGVVNVSFLSFIILRYTWRMHRSFFMNTNEFTIDCILRTCLKIWESNRKFSMFLFLLLFLKKKLKFWYWWIKKSKRWN